jgi:hypothetical protein
MLPADPCSGVHADLLSLLRSYDPDIVAGHIPLLEDEAHLNPAIAEQVMARYGPSGARRQDLWRHLSTQTIDPGPWDDVAQQADAWCSPFKGIHQDARSFAAQEFVPLARQADSYEYLTVMAPAPGEQLLTLDLSRADPVVALMIESRTGALDAHDQARLQPVELAVQQADLEPLVRMAMTGQTLLSGWDPGPLYLAAVGAAATGAPPVLSGEQFMQRTPFARTRRWLTPVYTSAAAPPPVVCVIGDTAADHALALLCDRLFLRAAWLPLSVLHDVKLGAAARLGIYELSPVGP